jgi:hypothetical protein
VFFKKALLSIFLASAAAMPASAAMPEVYLSTGLSVLGATAGLQVPLSPIAELNFRFEYLTRVQTYNVGVDVFNDSSLEGRMRLYMGPELLYYHGQGDAGRYQRLYAQFMLGAEHRLCGRMRLGLEFGPGVLLRNGFDGGPSPIGLPFSLMGRVNLLFPLI